MPRHSVTRTLPFGPDALFALVADVRRYPEFVPWISAMRVWNERDVGSGVRRLDAEATVGFSFFRGRFATRVTMDPTRRTIFVNLLSGPFRRLENTWTFEPAASGTLVRFDIDFEFRTRLLDGLLRANFDRAVTRLIGCFEARAASLHAGDAPASLGGAYSAAG